MFENKELAKWLEEAVRLFIENDKESKVTCGALVMQQENGNTMTGTFNCDINDKAVLAFNLISDALMEIVCANVDRVKDAIEELEEDS